MNREKVFEKFRHYWLMDDSFRDLIYSEQWFTPLGTISERLERKILSDPHKDFFLLWYRTCPGGSIKDFIRGLVGQKPVLNQMEFDFGRDLNLDGRLFGLWEDICGEASERVIDYRDWIEFRLYKNDFYFHGRMEAYANKLANESILALSVAEQSAYLLGRDSVLNMKAIRVLLRNLVSVNWKI